MNDNKLIADFMGLEFSKGEYYRPLYNSGDWIPENELEYHESWDWLMPVVRKIDNTITLSSKDESYLYCFDMVSENHVTIFDSLTSTTIVKVPFDKAYEREPVYKAVVKFIEWYNKKQ